VALTRFLPHAGDPVLYEPVGQRCAELTCDWPSDAHADRFLRSVDFRYIWGDVLEELDHIGPDLRLINLETAVTTSGDAWEGKEVHYRMSPQNVPCLTAAGIDCCALANNHVLDWGYAGFEETLQTLRKAGFTGVGAGETLKEAQRPAVFELPNGGRVLIFSIGSPSSGIPYRWAAAENRPGVHLIDESSPTPLRA
jgi:poly-gamma-glutamate capsule biosynthesis protein CapA/YwtB (metallophosphatase superfamily)